jgi:hypothetical protein
VSERTRVRKQAEVYFKKNQMGGAAVGGAAGVFSELQKEQRTQSLHMTYI